MLNHLPKDLLCVWDVEVCHGPDETSGGWSNPRGMDLASAVVYTYQDDRYHIFLHPSSREDLYNLLEGKICIGFNSVRFDTRVLLGNNQSVYLGTRLEDPVMTISQEDDLLLRHLDLMLLYCHSKWGFTDDWDQLKKTLDDPKTHQGGVFNLNALCKNTLGSQKTGHGAHAPKLYQQKKYDQLISYNLQDVRLTRKLFEYIQTYRQVINGQQEVIKIGGTGK